MVGSKADLHLFYFLQVYSIKLGGKTNALEFQGLRAISLLTPHYQTPLQVTEGNRILICLGQHESVEVNINL